MTQVKFEEEASKKAYSAGEISYEEYNKLMDDISDMLWDELYLG